MHSIKNDPNFALRSALPVRFVYWLDKKSNWINKMETERTKWLMDQFPLQQWLPQNSRILDLASGMGYITNYIKAQTKGEVWGVDLVDYRTTNVKKNTQYNFIIGDAYNLPFEDEYFDAVNIFVSLHHMVQPEKVIMEVLRIAKKNSKIIILEDLIKEKFSRQTIVTLFIDNLINLSFKKNPNTNKTKQQWIDLFLNKFNLKLEKEYSIKWGPFFKSLELGIFVLTKRD